MRGKKGFFHDFGVKTVGKRDPMSIFGLKRGGGGGGDSLLCFGVELWEKGFVVHPGDYK